MQQMQLTVLPTMATYKTGRQPVIVMISPMVVDLQAEEHGHMIVRLRAFLLTQHDLLTPHGIISFPSASLRVYMRLQSLEMQRHCSTFCWKEQIQISGMMMATPL